MSVVRCEKCHTYYENGFPPIELSASGHACPFQQVFISTADMSEMTQLREALAASQRRVEALEAANAELCTFMDDPLKVLTALRARLAAAEALIPKWRAVENYTPIPVHQGYEIAASELESALSANGEAAG